MEAARDRAAAAEAEREAERAALLQLRAERLSSATAALSSAPGLAELDWSPFPAWCERCLKIEDKASGRLIQFRLNSDQQRFIAQCLAQFRKTGRVRQIVVKRRQRGFSTVTQAAMLFAALRCSDTETLVMAHESEPADAIFRRVKTMYQELPIAEKRAQTLEATGARGAAELDLQRNNRKELQFREPWRSALRVAVPSEGAGRGSTRRFLHLSELPLWGSNAGSVLTGVLNSVPDAPGTWIVIESTARGIGNAFYERYIAAQEGASEYEAFFCDWRGHGDCRLEIPLDDPCWASTPPEWTEDEPRLRELGYDDAQLAWRRRAIRDKCEGQPAIFRQEYPSTAEEAFVSSGSNVFPPSVVDPQLKACLAAELARPAARYRIDLEPAAPGTAGRYLDPHGPLKVWREPETGTPYVIAGDVGRGLNVSGSTGDPSKLDYTTFRVIDQYRLEEVAAWHGRLDPDEAAAHMAWLGRYYNTALLVPEASGIYGPILIARLLKTIHYPRVWRKEEIALGTRDPVQQSPDAHYMRFGWYTGATNGITKGTMIGTLNEFVRDGEITIHDPAAWQEMSTFQRSADGSLNAISGRHDDIVMALAIAACILRLHPRSRPVAPVTERALEVVGPAEGGRAEGVRVNYAVLQRRAEARRGSERGRDDFT